jgi:hypothetical protein
LAQALIAQSVKVSILVSVSEQDCPLKIWQHEGCEVISIKAMRTKDIGYIRRTINEFVNPWFMWRILKKSSHFQGKNYDGVVWYSPTIFWGPLIKKIKNKFRCKSYLILRDIFPDWAMHLGVIEDGFAYWFFKKIEQYQYRQADYIGVQSLNNLSYFQKHNPDAGRRAQVLWNWISKPLTSTPKAYSINLSNTFLRNKVVFVYAGNLGVAQGGAKNLLALAKNLRSYPTLGILVVGRGSAIDILRYEIANANLNNILVHDEIDATEMPSLLKQCHIGLVLLDRRHLTHNIPGKFLTYLQSGLPVLAWVNPGNDLIELISTRDLGFAYAGENIIEFANLARVLANKHSIDTNFSGRSNKFLEKQFSPSLQARQIIFSLAEA